MSYRLKQIVQSSGTEVYKRLVEVPGLGEGRGQAAPLTLNCLGGLLRSVEVPGRGQRGGEDAQLRKLRHYSRNYQWKSCQDGFDHRFCLEGYQVSSDQSSCKAFQPILNNRGCRILCKPCVLFSFLSYIANDGGYTCSRACQSCRHHLSEKVLPML